MYLKLILECSNYVCFLAVPRCMYPFNTYNQELHGYWIRSTQFERRQYTKNTL